MKKFFGGAVLALLIVFLLPGISSSAANKRTIANGVYVGTVNISGMSVSEAQAAVEQRVQELGARQLSLVASEGQVITVTGQELGISWANRDVVTEAFELGHAGNIAQRYKALKDLENSNKIYDLQLSYDEDALNALLERCSSEFDQEKVNFSLTRTEEGFSVSEGQTGYLVDAAGSAEAIKNVIGSEWSEDAEDINLVIKADEPLGSYDELSRVKDVLGTYTTSYKTSGSARSANVANGCALINGATIYPGEEFSVLDTITPFTEANGYYPAGSYLNGLVVESVGGGICQVSTTLYNAVLLAELEVTERHCHSMIVNYVSPSADAAIAESGGKNFKFINSTEHPIYIEGYTTPDKHITFTVYGIETRPATHKVSYESEVLETIPASAPEFRFDGSQGLGYVGSQSAHTGYKAQLWRIVTENGEVTDKSVVNTSVYKMVPQIVTIGTAGADESAMNQLNTAVATKDVNTIRSVAGALGAARSAAGTENAEAANQAAQDAVNAANAQLAQQQEAAQQEDLESVNNG